MKNFFKSVKFKVILCISALFLGVILFTAITGKTSIITSSFSSFLVTPVQSVASSISNKVKGVISVFKDREYLLEENRRLNDENTELKEQMVDHEKMQKENEQYKEYWGIKDTIQDCKIRTATIISRSPEDPYSSFAINKGSLEDVGVGNPVITSKGLVGYVTEVTPLSATVETILSPNLNVGGKDIRTVESGIITGDSSLMKKGQCKMKYLQKSTSASKGDIVVTTGDGGKYPENLIIGTIDSIETESTGLSCSAIITPEDDILHITSVAVITSFNGKVD